MLISSAFLYFFLSLLITCSFSVRLNLPKMLISFYLITYTCNVIIYQLLSLVDLLSQRWLVIVFQIILLVIAHLILIKSKRLNYRSIKSKLIGLFSGLQPSEYIMTFFIVAILGLFFFVGISTPPNNQDSLHTHLPRIYYWLQHGSFNYWNATTTSQLTTPINSNIQGLWIFLLSRNENLFFLVQWFSLVAIIACVYEIAVFLSFSSSSALFSILISLTFPVLTIQTYSFQGDLTVATLFMIAILFILKTQDQNGFLFFLTAVLAICLAIGTKQTSFFVLPVLAVYMLFYLFKRFTVIASLKIMGISLIIFFVFSSYTYIQNYLFTKQVFGYYDTGKTAFSYMENLNNKAKYVFPRYFYQAISVEGLPRYVQTDLLRIKGNLFKSYLIPRGINLESEEHIQPGSSDNEKFNYYSLPYMNEENSWFGILAFPIAMVTLILSIFSQKKIIRNYALFVIALSVIYTIFIFLQRPGWDPYQGRYFILILAPLIPLFSIVIPRRQPWNSVVIFTLLPGIMFLALNIFFTNSSKPIINSRQIYSFQSKYILPLPDDTRLEIIAKNYLVKKPTA